MRLEYSLHAPYRGHQDIEAFMTRLREAFPDLEFWGTEDLIAEGDFVVVRWEGGGTHTGPACYDFRIGLLPAATGRKMHVNPKTSLRFQNRHHLGVKTTESVTVDLVTCCESREPRGLSILTSSDTFSAKVSLANVCNAME
jgi:hypothetical protein